MKHIFVVVLTISSLVPCSLAKSIKEDEFYEKDVGFSTQAQDEDNKYNSSQNVNETKTLPYEDILAIKKQLQAQASGLVESVVSLSGPNETSHNLTERSAEDPATCTVLHSSRRRSHVAKPPHLHRNIPERSPLESVYYSKDKNKLVYMNCKEVPIAPVQVLKNSVGHVRDTFPVTSPGCTAGPDTADIIAYQPGRADFNPGYSGLLVPVAENDVQCVNSGSLSDPSLATLRPQTLSTENYHIKKNIEPVNRDTNSNLCNVEAVTADSAITSNEAGNVRTQELVPCDELPGEPVIYDNQLPTYTHVTECTTPTRFTENNIGKYNYQTGKTIPEDEFSLNSNSCQETPQPNEELHRGAVPTVAVPECDPETFTRPSSNIEHNSESGRFLEDTNPPNKHDPTLDGFTPETVRTDVFGNTEAEDPHSCSGSLGTKDTDTQPDVDDLREPSPEQNPEAEVETSPCTDPAGSKSTPDNELPESNNVDHTQNTVQIKPGFQSSLDTVTNSETYNCQSEPNSDAGDLESENNYPNSQSGLRSNLPEYPTIHENGGEEHFASEEENPEEVILQVLDDGSSGDNSPNDSTLLDTEPENQEIISSTSTVISDPEPGNQKNPTVTETLQNIEDDTEHPYVITESLVLGEPYNDDLDDGTQNPNSLPGIVVGNGDFLSNPNLLAANTRLSGNDSSGSVVVVIITPPANEPAVEYSRLNPNFNPGRYPFLPPQSTCKPAHYYNSPPSQGTLNHPHYYNSPPSQGTLKPAHYYNSPPSQDTLKPAHYYNSPQVNEGFYEHPYYSLLQQQSYNPFLYNFQFPPNFFGYCPCAIAPESVTFIPLLTDKLYDASANANHRQEGDGSCSSGFGK